MADEEFDIHAPCKREIARLQNIVDTQAQRLARLEEALGLNSSNSGRPPSSDDPKAKFSRKKRKPSGKKRGAQPGHKGRKRRLLPPDQVDHFVAYKPQACEGCGSSLAKQPSSQDSNPLRQQVLELPKVLVELTEYQAHARRCRSCGVETRAPFPEDLPASCVGPRLQAFMALLTARFGASRRDVEDFLPMVLGEKARVSLGTVSNAEARTSRALKSAWEGALEAVREEPSLHVDETTWREENVRRYIWTAVAKQQELTVYRIGRRTREQLEDLLGDFSGTVHNDRYGAYRYLGSRRCFCWAHLSREFERMGLRDVGSQEIGRLGLEVSDGVFAAWKRHKTGLVNRRSLRKALDPLKRKLRAALEQGQKLANDKTAGTCRALLRDEGCLWRFAEVEGGEPTNNTAERALRGPVILRKTSFGSQSRRGSVFLERVWSVVESCRAQGRDVLDFVAESCSCLWNGRSPPTLAL